MDDATTLSAREARALMTDTETDVRRRIEVRSAPLFAAWGVFWVAGYLAVWWSVRGQRDYVGPQAWALGVMGVLGVLALVVTALTIVRATRGIGGAAQRQGMFYGLSWPVAFVAAEAVVVGIGRTAAEPEVVGVASAVVPALVVAVVYCVSAALWEAPAFFVAGATLAVAAGAGALTGPVTGMLVLALVGGAGFVAATVIAARQR